MSVYIVSYLIVHWPDILDYPEGQTNKHWDASADLNKFWD